jgi:hypothetical protein
MRTFFSQNQGNSQTFYSTTHPLHQEHNVKPLQTPQSIEIDISAD